MFEKKWTGERLETFIINDTMIEHLHRYALTKNLVKDLVVLDIACGEGYGSNLMAQEAKLVIGVDIDKETVSAAQGKYKKENLSYKEGSTSNIPCQNDFFDIVVSFETIEHHNEHEQMIAEIKRVLKPEGILIISTPDKKQYSDIPNYQNPFHIKEMYEKEFKALIKKNFRNQIFLQQQPIYGSLIINETLNNNWTSFKGNYQNINACIFENGVYIIAIASDASLQNLPLSNSFWTDKDLLTMNSDKIKTSIRYRLGNFLLSPIDWLIQLSKLWKQ
jgi:2-polyprenyl-3-methyl-5-hydroxy-6-metoxy-1,4-benzoquinol methylase